MTLVSRCAARGTKIEPCASRLVDVRSRRVANSSVWPVFSAARRLHGIAARAFFRHGRHFEWDGKLWEAWRYCCPLNGVIGTITAGFTTANPAWAVDADAKTIKLAVRSDVGVSTHVHIEDVAEVGPVGIPSISQT